MGYAGLGGVVNEAGTWEKRNRFLITPATAQDRQTGNLNAQDKISVLT